METKNNSLVLGIALLILGLLGGYFVGTSRTPDYPAGMMGYGNNTPVNMHDAMGGMMSGLSGKTGDALDQAFLDEMIVHHQGAVEMAQVLLSGTKRPELIKLGNDIISAQTGEIEMMKGWRTSWFGQ